MRSLKNSSETQLLGPEQHSRLEKARKERIRAPEHGHERQFVHRARGRLKGMLTRRLSQFVHLRGSGQVPIRACKTLDSGVDKSCFRLRTLQRCPP